VIVESQPVPGKGSWDAHPVTYVPQSRIVTKDGHPLGVGDELMWAGKKMTVVQRTIYGYIVSPSERAREVIDWRAGG
jgi:hypothetical protein